MNFKRWSIILKYVRSPDLVGHFFFVWWSKWKFHNDTSIKKSAEAEEILEQLSDGESLRTSEDWDEDQYCAFDEANIWIVETHARVDVVTDWFPDVTKFIKALWKSGFATDKNLSVLFGKIDFDSYLI